MMAERSFESGFAEHFERFLAHHRALGKRYENEEAALFLLDRFLVAQGIESPDRVTSEHLEAFLRSRKRCPRSRNHLLCVLRQLFRWLANQQLLPASPLRSRSYRSVGSLQPFLFGPEDVRQILARADALPATRNTPHRGPAYRMIFALMYGLGLRVGEVSRLRLQDVDTERHCLLVRETKFLKSRLVPFGPRMADSLQAYLDRRTPAAAPEHPLFSSHARGERTIPPRTISCMFSRIVAKLDLAVPPGTAQPRLHGLRHSFAVSTLLGWYRDGIDPGTRLMHLSVFLGHVDPTSTAVYLTITPELRRLASQRFERYAEPALKGLPS